MTMSDHFSRATQAQLWVDLPALRTAYLEAGFTEHRRTDLPAGAPERVVLMSYRADAQPDQTAVLRTTLTRLGWEHRSSDPGKFEVWQISHQDGGSSDELILPLDPAKGDYQHLLQRAYRQVRTRHGRNAVSSEVDILVPIVEYQGWQERARDAVTVLEEHTGRVRPELGALTAREAALWRVITETRAVVENCPGGNHTVDDEGYISHRTDNGAFDPFEHGRCEMRQRVIDRLDHVLAGGE